MGTNLETDFFGTCETYLIVVTYDPPEGMIFNDRRDIRRFTFWNEREYNRKRMDLLETTGIESMFCTKNCTTTSLSSRKNKIV